MHQGAGPDAGTRHDGAGRTEPRQHGAGRTEPRHDGAGRTRKGHADVDRPHTWRAVAALHAFEQLTTFGWSMPVRTFRVLIRVATGVSAAVLVAATVVVVDVIRLTALPLVPQGSRGAVVLLAYLAACGYLLALGVWREAATRRRDLVAASPHAALFRALDVPATTVLTVWVLPAIARTTLFALAVATGYVAVTADLLAEHVVPPVLLAVPVAVGAVQLAIAARAARPSTAPRSRTARRVGMVVAVVLVAGAGRLVSVSVGAGSGGWPDWTLTRPVTTALVAVGAALAVLVAAAAVTGAHRALHVHPFPIGAEADEHPARRSLDAARGPVRWALRGPGWWVLRATRTAMWTGRPGRLRRRWWAGAALAAGVAVGLAPIAREVPTGGTGRLAVLVAFLSLLALTESDMQATGPTAVAARLRAVHELGAPSRRLAAGLTGAVLADGLLVGLGVLAVLWCATGTVQTGPVLVATAVAVASVLADAVSPGRLRSDGTASLSMGAALLTVLVTVPVAGLLVTGSAGTAWTWTVAVAAGVVVVIGMGGVACVRRTVLMRPSTLPA